MGWLPYALDKIAILSSNDHDSGKCLCSWDSLSVIDYIGGKKFGKEDIWEILREIIKSFIIPATGSEQARQAFHYLGNDFEDAMQIAAAVAGNADYLVTRDQSGFGSCPVTVCTAAECVEFLGN